MKKITQEEFDKIKRNKDGIKVCPGFTDYSLIDSFPEYCSFGKLCKFGRLCSFGERCSFGEWYSFGERCDFGKLCRFGEQCSFGKQCSFGEWCSFGELCSFGEWCSFGERCSFGEWCSFGNLCKGIPKEIFFSAHHIIETKEKIFAFKYLTKNMESPVMDKKIKYEISKTYKEKTDMDEEKECSFGLNVASKWWCQTTMSQSDRLFLVEIPKTATIVIPTQSSGKFRVSEMKIIEELITKKWMEE